MKILIQIISVLLLGTFITVWGQQQQESKQFEQLQTRILVIEDYLKNRLDKLTQQVNRKHDLLKKLYESNLQLRQEVADMHQRLKVAEAELLRLKIEIAAIKKGESGITPVEERSPQAAVEKRPLTPKYRDPKMQQLANALKSTETSIRIHSVVSLDRLETPDATSLLIKALADADAYVVLLACKALVKRKALTAVAPLIALLSSDNEKIRRFAHMALQKITGRQLQYYDDPQQNIAGWQQNLKKP